MVQATVLHPIQDHLAAIGYEMTRTSLLLLPLIALAACSSPRERCIAGANRGIATVDRLIVETQGNLQRGFGLREVQDVRVVDATCRGENEDGTEFRFECEETQTRTRQEPVTLNLADERAKLIQLRERRDNLSRAAQQRVQQCIAANPE
jgi:hypothetical protein